MPNLKSKCHGKEVVKDNKGYFCAGIGGCGRYCEVKEKPEEKKCYSEFSICPKCSHKYPVGGLFIDSPTQTDDWEKWGKHLINRFYDLYLEKGDKKGSIDYFEARTFLYNAVLTAKQEERERVIEGIENYQMDLCENSQDFKNYVINLLKSNEKTN